MTQSSYPQQWHWLALLMMFVGAVGSVQNIIIFMLEKNIFSGVMGAVGLIIWYLIYQRKFLGLAMLNVLILINVVMFLGKMILAGFSFRWAGDILLQIALIGYFDYQVLNGMFEV